MSWNKRIFVVTVIILLVFTSFPPKITTAATNERLVYLSGVHEYGEVKDMKVIQDGEDTHVFFRVANSTGDKLIHLYNHLGITHYEIVEDYAAGIELYSVNSFAGTVSLLYGITTGLGAKTIKSYSWTPQTSFYKEITQLSANLLYYVTFLKVFKDKGLIHVFYTYIYGDDAKYTNVTHIYGTNLFKSEQFSLNGINTTKMRNTLDIALDSSGTIWYWYRHFDSDRRVGVGILENNTLVPLGSYTFTGLQNPIENLHASEEFLTNVNVSAVFTQPRKLIVMKYGNHSLVPEIYDIVYEHPQVAEYDVADNVRYCILTDTVGDANYTGLYYGYATESADWKFAPVVSSLPIMQNEYGIFLDGENYAIVYQAQVDPNDYAPTGIRYKETTGIALFVISNTAVNIATYRENLSAFSPFVKFLINNWIWIVIAAVAVITFTVTFAIFWKKKGKEVKAFLFDPRVGAHLPKFLRMWKNVGRYLYNRFSLIFTIFTSNKKRTLFTILGFLLTGYLISSAIIIAQSEESAMIKAYYRVNPLTSNDVASAQLTTAFYGGTNTTANYDFLTKQALMDIYASKLISKYLSRIMSAYYCSVKLSPIYPNPLIINYKFVSLPDETSAYFETILSEGHKPQNPNEIVINGQLARRFSLGVNDTIVLLAQENTNTPYLEVNFTISGIYEKMNVAQIRKISAYLERPNDLYTLLSVADFITTNTLFFKTLATISEANLKIHGIYQYYFDFNKFIVSDITELIAEQRQLQYTTFALSFDEYSQITLSNELYDFFSHFNRYYFNNLARLLIFAIPAILLAIFMIIESSELFASSYQNEVEILRNRGIKNRRIAAMYVITRLMEIVIATVLSYGLAVLTAIPLIKVNGFITFRNTDTHLVIENSGLELLFVGLVLFLISLPRILVIVRRKKVIEKEPNKIIKALKTISWRELFFLLLGLVLLLYFYNETFRAYYENHSTNFILYLNLTIIGAIFTLVGGLPIVVKLIGGAWKAVGFLAWRTKKTKVSFIFAEISRDIKYFENITLIFLIISAILIPVFVVPYSKELTLSEQAHFVNGSDLRIRDWNKITGVDENTIRSIPGVKSTTYAQLYMLYLGIFEGVRILVINITSFTDTFYKPNNQISNIKWSELNQLTNDTII
ncbi:MAG: hypothetical protein ACTSUF_05110, partial [Candidatus Heimdallarchaeaceae archaeon]